MMAETKAETAKSEAKTESKVEANKILPPGQQPPGDIRRRVPKKQRKGPFVKYVGVASHRQISAADWKTLSIPLRDDGATHTWSVANDKMVESSAFTDEQLDYLLIDDVQRGTNTHNFLEVDFDSDGQLVQVTE
jgi:hypothetical protein